jgi:uncharacterized protein YdeI (YjbR/CyaY-like superfamily)
MPGKTDTPIFYPHTRQQWRKWLEKNHAREKSVRLVLVHKKATSPGIRYEDAVEEALCYGWIDSTVNKRDAESYLIYFAQRNPKSKWSKSNKLRVSRLADEGLMKPPGQAMIDLAKKSGTWNILDPVEDLEMPQELEKSLNKNKTANKNFQAFSPSSKKMIFSWILDAKRPETRERRIEKTVDFAAKNLKSFP